MPLEVHDVREHEEIVHSTTMRKLWVSDKGYIQLAIRSGQYRKLNVMAIKEGELIKFDPLNEEIEIKLVEDWDIRESLPTAGYYAFFELVNGYRKAIYWSRKQMESHADRFSSAFSLKATTIKVRGEQRTKVSFEDYKAGNYDKADEWMYSSFWYKNFDAMAYKTMLRHLISKWGVMSIQMQTAYSNDMTATGKDGNQIYVDSDADVIDMSDSVVPTQTEEKPADENNTAVADALFKK